MIDINKFTGDTRELAKRIRTLEEAEKSRLTFASDVAEELFDSNDVQAHRIVPTGGDNTTVTAEDVRKAGGLKS